MRKRGVFWAAAFLLTGCLNAYEPDPSQGGQTATPGDTGGTGSGTGVGGGGDTTSGGDMATATGGGGGDAGGTAPTDGGAPADASACVNKSAQTINGNHNPGTNCLPCHDGNNAPKFTIGGTLYSAATGGTPIAQANIVVTDGAGKTFTMVTASSGAVGNFWYTQAVTFPISVKASSCPNTAVMFGAVQASGGGCASCHNSTFQIHLP